jgi:hypothetical protein
MRRLQAPSLPRLPGGEICARITEDQPDKRSGEFSRVVIRLQAGISITGRLCYISIMPITVIKTPVQLEELKKLAQPNFIYMIKAVVDTVQGIMAVGGELHADEELELTEHHGSKRENVWGINLYLDKEGDEFLEYSSMINLKPHSGNRSRGVEDWQVREKIAAVVEKLILK